MNVQQEGERLVVRDDVAPFADKSCKTCHGAGAIRITPPAKPVNTILCGCAIKRFIRKNASQIRRDDATGEIYWRG